MVLTNLICLKVLLMPCLMFIVISGTLILRFLSLVVPVLGSYEDPFIKPSRCLLSIITPLFASYYGLKKGSLNYSGSQTGFIVGFIMTMSSYTFMASLLVFFIVCSKVTNWNSMVKRTFEENFKEGGKRNWLQVICNGGVAAELALLYCIDSGSKELPINFSKYYTSSWLSCGIVGALACSCGDTFASEIGAAIGAEPRLITNLRRVPRGTNGAISLVGTMASILGGFLIGLTFFITNTLIIDEELLDASPPQWPIILLGMFAGFIGSLMDSLLGATLQFSGINKETGVICECPGKDVTPISGTPFFDNHNVNLLASLFAATMTSLTAYKIFEHYQ